MDTHSSSLRPLTLIAEAKRLLRVAARDTEDPELKFDADGIATQVDDLIKRNSRIEGGE